MDYTRYRKLSALEDDPRDRNLRLALLSLDQVLEDLEKDLEEDLEREGRPRLMAPEANRELQQELRRELEGLEELWKRKHRTRPRKRERSSEAAYGLLRDPAGIAMATASAIFAKAYLETLAKRAAEGTANLPKKLKDLVRDRIRRRGKLEEFRIGTRDGSAATIVVTDDTPDEARLALLDLDVTAPELRGKLLRWDEAVGAWRPSESAQPDGATSTD
jgi:hypothetical protein